MKRKALRPKIRFEIFERDNFTCQYCGRTPEMDGVVLVVDHIISIKDGGTNDSENLITSCFDCNAGKGAKSKPKKTIKQIEENINREQERIEQLKKINSRNKKLIRLKEESKKLSRQWIYDIIGSSFVDKIYNGIEKTVVKYNKSIVKEALDIMSLKDFDTVNVWLKYFNGICKNLSIPKKERDILKMYQELLQNPFINGSYDWTVKQSYDVAKLVIHDYSSYGKPFHKRIINRINIGFDKLRGQKFLARKLTKKYTGENSFTVWKSGKNANIFIIDCIIAEDEYQNK